MEPEIIKPISWKQLQNNEYRYKKIKQIGEGRFSVVYYAEDSINKDNPVVIKVQRRGKINRETMEDELKILLKLKQAKEYSPYVVKLLDYFTVNVATDKKKRNAEPQKSEIKEYPYDRLCLVFDKMKCDLLKLKNDIYMAPVPVSVVKHIAKCVLQGLKFLHDNKIIHTDIKPENVLVGKDSDVKIADVGNACYFNEHFSDTISTSEYRAPESILVCDYNEKADIWSSACLFYELLTDDYLFDSWAYLEDLENDDDDTETQRSESGYSSENEDREDYDSGVEEDEEEDNSIAPSDSDSDSDDESDELLNDIQHLHLMEQTLGKIPKYISKQGDNFDLYFNRKGGLKEPIEKVEKMSIAEGLEYDYNFSKEVAKGIEDFLLPMLQYDPEKRASAEKMLKHPWLK